jgi:hypothetical protein
MTAANVFTYQPTHPNAFVVVVASVVVFTTSTSTSTSSSCIDSFHGQAFGSVSGSDSKIDRDSIHHHQA